MVTINTIARRLLLYKMLIITLIILNFPLLSFGIENIFYEGQLDRQKALESTLQITKEKYENADTVIVDQHYWVRYNNEGTYKLWNEGYIKILSEKGKRDFKTLSSSFSLNYNSTEFKFIEIIKMNGSVNTINIEENTKTATESTQIEDNIYDPKDKILTVNIPQLDIGDTVHYLIFDNYYKVPVPGTFSFSFYLQENSPIKRSEVTIIGPNNLPLKSISLESEIHGTVINSFKEDGKWLTYNWVVSDVPMAIPEPEMPPLETQIQRLLISTIGDWNWISRWYWELCRSKIENITPEMKNTVKLITQNLNDDSKKIKAIFRWVSQEIRYLGITVEKESPGYEPHPVKMTFDRKAGVCRDKAALLTAMLRIAGFDAYPALIMTGPKMEEKVPRPFFNHAITAIKNFDGSYLLMDSTDETTKELLPGYLNNKSFLVATPIGDTLRTTPCESADKNMVYIYTQGEFSDDGILNANTTIKFNGINDNLYRDLLINKTPIERRDYFEKVLNANNFSVKLIKFNLTPENLSDIASPLKVELAFEADDTQVLSNDSGMITVPFIGKKIGIVQFLAEKISLENRHYPLVTEFPCGLHEEFKIKLNKTAIEETTIPKIQSYRQ